MKSSFNAYGSASRSAGDFHVPVWAGFPGVVPVGGMLDPDYLIAGALYGAGTAVLLKDKKITPFIAWEVVSMATVDTNDVITIKPVNDAVLPEVGDFIQKVGATFAATGKAAAVTAVTALTGADAGKYTVTVLHSATVDALSAGDAIALSAATAAGSGKSLAVIPNGYLYNDIFLGDIDVTRDDAFATGAVVQHLEHGAILINRTPSAVIAKQMLAAVPGVSQDYN